MRLQAVPELVRLIQRHSAACCLSKNMRAGRLIAKLATTAACFEAMHGKRMPRCRSLQTVLGDCLVLGPDNKQRQQSASHALMQSDTYHLGPGLVKALSGAKTN
mmetsp:Transcript_15211/g.45885  ORF Transcript_15211/g.45885 Transcript_15211/m.45885 type:complete len:104 (-) Transcript_15211:2859-3170(-)